MLSAIMVMTEEIKADQTKCYALALSSGDESAAYQAGALSGIFNSNLQPTDYQYDAISGISGGALNAVMLASFAKGSEKDAATRIEKFWVDASNSQLYKNWIGGISRGLFFEGGLYNSAPLEDFLKSQFNNVTIERKLDVGIVDVADGTYKDFSELNSKYRK